MCHFPSRIKLSATKNRYDCKCWIENTNILKKYWWKQKPGAHKNTIIYTKTKPISIVTDHNSFSFESSAQQMQHQSTLFSLSTTSISINLISFGIFIEFSVLNLNFFTHLFVALSVLYVASGHSDDARNRIVFVELVNAYRVNREYSKHQSI